MSKSACVKFSRSAHGTVGCTVGVAPHVFIGAYGEDAADALSKAGKLASELQQRLDENPEVAAALQLVPGGQEAFAAIAAAAALYNSGLSAREVARQVGPTAAGVVKSILRRFGV